MTMENNPIKALKGELEVLIKEAIGRAISKGELPSAAMPSFTVEIPADKKNGDLASNAAMVSARAFKLAPIKIANLIASNMEFNDSSFERCEIAGPGFLNFFIGVDWYSKAVTLINTRKADFGKTEYGNGKKVLVEFVSANPTGPMHIGNARGGAIGDSLASVFEWAGYSVSREFYVNDAGNQINKFAVSLEARYLQIYDDSFIMPEDGYLGQDIIDHATAFSKINGDRYVNLSSDERKKALVEYALPLNIKGLEQDLLRYRIQYDTWFMESVLHNNNEVDRVITLLKESGHTYEKEGALWFKATDFGNDIDFVLVRSNGVPTYVVPDIAYHYNKLVTRQFDMAVDVLGADHHGYIPRLKAALSALGVDSNRLNIVLMQMVRLVRGKEIVKASKRSGKAITLVTLLDEVPIDAARFFFNLREPNSQLDFDLDLAIEQSSQNPVYYVQYAHARICSIIRNLQKDGATQADITSAPLHLLTTAEERELIKLACLLPNEVEDSTRLLEPSRITRYAGELASAFHKFYNSCRVMSEDKDLTCARMYLCMAVREVLANVLTMLKISAPQEM